MSQDKLPQDKLPQDKSTAHRAAQAVRLALCAALAGLVLSGGCSAARAGDDDTRSISDKLLHSLGIHRTATEDLDYSERSPLVVPPTRNLPPPATANAVPAPNWPQDPDNSGRQSDGKKSDAKGAALQGDARRMRAAVAPPGIGEQSTPSQRGEEEKSIWSFEWLKTDERGTFTGEPPRASLTDPPHGYLTPSPDQPYGITPEKGASKGLKAGERGVDTR